MKGSVGNKCLRQIEFRVVFHPSAHLFLGVCNGLATFLFLGGWFSFLKSLKVIAS